MIVFKSLLVSQLGVYLNFRRGYFLAGHFLLLSQPFLLLLSGSQAPHPKELTHIGHPMIGVEQCSHRIEQVLILLQILLAPNILEFEYFTNVHILQSRVLLQIAHQFLQEHELVCTTLD